MNQLWTLGDYDVQSWVPVKKYKYTILVSDFDETRRLFMFCASKMYRGNLSNTLWMFLYV